MKKVILLTLISLSCFVLVGCTKIYKDALAFFNDSEIVKVEYVEYTIKDMNEKSETYLEQYFPLQIDDMESYIQELNSLDCESDLFRDYFWEGSGDIKFYYEDGSTLKWDGTMAKYTDKNGEQKSKFLENQSIWYITSKYANVNLGLEILINDKDNFVLSKYDTIWVGEDSRSMFLFGDATSFAYCYNLDTEEMTTESYVYDDRTYTTLRNPVDKLDIADTAIGNIKYKDSVLNVKYEFEIIGRDLVNTVIYYLNNRDGTDKPEVNSNNVITECFISYKDNTLILQEKNGDGRFEDLFDQESEVKFLFHDSVED